MKKYELDGRICLDKEDFCLRLIALLHLPDYCGKNLDALSDCLTTLPEAAELTITHFASMEKRLGSWGRRLRKMLMDASDGKRLLVSLPEAKAPTAEEVNAMGQAMEQEIRDAGLVIFENDDHFAYLRQWPRFVTVVRAFLT